MHILLPYNAKLLKYLFLVTNEFSHYIQ